MTKRTRSPSASDVLLERVEARERAAADPRHAEGRQLVFFAGDDADAKTRFAEVVEAFGFATLDVGALHDGGRLISVGGGPLAGFHALKQDV